MVRNVYTNPKSSQDAATTSDTQLNIQVNNGGISAHELAHKARALAFLKKTFPSVEPMLASGSRRNKSNTCNSNDVQSGVGSSKINSEITTKGAVEGPNNTETDEKNLDGNEDVIINNANDEPGEKKIGRIRKPIIIRVKRRCHHCHTAFNASAECCDECDHQKCDECPRSPPLEVVSQVLNDAGADNSVREVSWERQRFRSASVDAEEDVSRKVASWLDDMNPRAEKADSADDHNHLPEEEKLNLRYVPESSTNLQHPEIFLETQSKQKKQKKKKKKESQHCNDSRTASDHSIKPRFDAKRRSVSRTQGPSLVVAIPPKPQHIPLTSLIPGRNSRSGPKSKSNPKSETNPRPSNESKPDTEEAPEHSDAAAAAMTATATAYTETANQRLPAQPQRQYLYQYFDQRYRQGIDDAQLVQIVELAQGWRLRVRKKPRMRVRWACDRCMLLLDPESKECVGCGHVRCEDCIREPYVPYPHFSFSLYIPPSSLLPQTPIRIMYIQLANALARFLLLLLNSEKRKPSQPRPEVVEALEARLASITLREQFVS